MLSITLAYSGAGSGSPEWMGSEWPETTGLGWKGHGQKPGDLSEH